jgi:hypothetical protein
MRQVVLTLGVFGLVLILSAQGSAAIVADFNTDFSIAGNPNGAWTYGYAGGGTFNTYTTTVTNGNGFGWFGYLAGDGTPAIWKNTSGTTLNGVADGQVSLHPGPGNQASIARWTATTAETITLNGQFFTGDSGAMLVGIFQNATYNAGGQPTSTALWSNYSPFNLSVAVLPGDTIDFDVYGAYFSGNTPLSATISDSSAAIPEPSSLIVFGGLGGLGFAGYFWRRNRRPV